MKPILVVVSLIFFLTIPASSTPLFAQEIPTDPTVSSIPTNSMTTTPVLTVENKEIQYDLPYPGILPDNPLYFLKVIRDKLQEFFISDPLQRASFDVSQADKRMNASIYLSNEKSVKDSIISSTVSKAFNYFEQAISEVRQAKGQGEDVTGLVSRMDTASQKYRQLVLELQTSASPYLKPDLMGDKQRIDALHAVVTSMEQKQ